MFLQTYLTNTVAVPNKILMQYELNTQFKKCFCHFFFNMLVPWPLNNLTLSISCILYMMSVA